MIAMTLAEVAAAVGAQVPHDADGASEVTGVSIDSRTAGPGDVFFALVGERVDGHDYVGAALDRGAVAVVVERATGVRALVVSDVLRALSELAAAWRGRLSPEAVVGLTGSVGKTSTKDLIATVLETQGSTIATQGSFNNEIGLPLTLLRADPSTRFLVAEMGARGPGHVAALCATARPDVGLVLNVGTAHLGEFGTREAIAAAKQELVIALPPEGTAVLNIADPLVAAMASETQARVFTFGAPGADVTARDLAVVDGRSSFVIDHAGRSAAVSMQLVGLHQVDNALAAAAVALVLGLDLEQIATALSAATARSKWRMELFERPDGVTVLNDAYNASPESMRAALRALASLGDQGARRTWAVLGNMAELGDTADEIHYEIGRLAIDLDVSRLVVIGERAAGIHAGAMSVRIDGRGIALVADLDAAFELLADELGEGDVVLVKGSRAAGLERLAALLCRDSA